MTRVWWWWGVGGVLLASLAQAEPFDGVVGDALPVLPACWMPCPPVRGEHFAQASVFVRREPFQCVTVCRYRASDPFPRLPGGFSAWQPQAVPEPCPRGTGQATWLRITGSGVNDWREDSGCWTPE